MTGRQGRGGSAMRVLISLILTGVLLGSLGCSSLPQPIEPQVSAILEQEFCDEVQPLLRSTPLEISETFFFNVFFEANGYVNPITGTVHLKAITLRYASESELGKTQLRQYVVHEYLHFLWFDGRIDRRGFKEAYSRLTGDAAYQSVVQSVEDELAQKGILNLLFFGTTETYSKVGERIALGERLPEYILLHYRGILVDATGAPQEVPAAASNQFPFPLRDTVGERRSD